LLHEINTAPLPKWTKLKNRRLQTYGARVGGEGDKPAVFVDDFPKLIDGVREKLGELLTEREEDKPNNCLVNEYLPGQGILPHEDGPAFHPVIATVSLGGSCILDLYPKGGGDRGKRQPTCRLLLAPNSLLVMTNEAYTSHLHGIDETDVDTVHLAAGNNVANWDETEVGGNPTNGNIVKMPREETRVSVTFRSAKRVV
ncbi:uncharacterized protein EV422DRAFT_479952, partial [Fimicolochytrium jonesii]|uniref:uncharacterized protein n=1 Tax=Fimicolochytrium jonesii TaxID=1396493 RepID=UPI0022FDB695